MKLSLDIQPFTLPFAKPLRMAWGEVRERSGVMVYLLRDGERVACAECAPLPGYSHETLDMCVEALRDVERRNLGELLAFGMDPELLPERLPPAASFALQTLALTDRLVSGRTPAIWQSRAPRPMVAIQTLVANEAEALHAVEQGFRTLKIKVGVNELSSDIARVRAIRSALDRAVTLRLDANRAWSFEDATTFLEGVANCAIEFIEEPLRSSNPQQLRELQLKTGVHIAVDESVRDRSDIESHLDVDGARIFVLKPTMLGGPLTTLHLARMIESDGGQVVLSNTFDGPIGLAVIAATAARCRPGTHGLGTATLFANRSVFPEMDRGRIAARDLQEVCT